MDEPPPLFVDLPEGAETPREAGDQEREGLSPRHKRAATLLMRLATTSRSFVLYDPNNEAIQRFLSGLLEAFVGALTEEGVLLFDLRPFEVIYEGTSVYLNRDRERSLAFRLYRDGVRQLKFSRGFDWEELAKLLGILSTRYTGVHQAEDDAVTLLWKADFKHLEFVAVEGIVPEDSGPPETAAGAILELPEDVDLPRPALPTPTAPSWTEVTQERLAEIRSEASSAHLAEDCLRLAQALRERLNHPEDGLLFAETAHVFVEMRDFLSLENDLPHLKRFVTMLWQMSGEAEPAWDAGRHSALYELLESCGDRRGVLRLLRSVPPESRKLDPELVEVLDRACPDPLMAVADCLAEERGIAVRAVARQLLERYGKNRLDVLVKRFEASSGELASDFLRVIAGIGGDEATAFVARQASHRDGAVVDEALWHLEHMPYSGGVGRAFFDAFRWTDPGRRARVLGMIARSKDRRFVDLLADYVEEQAERLPQGEAAVIGQVLGTLGGADSVERWGAWLRPTGLIRKVLEGPLARKIAAALALSEIPEARAQEILLAALDVAEPDAQHWILGALGQRERRLGGSA